MTTATDNKKWFDEFVVELRLRGVLGSSIGDAVASARELLADTGESATDAFGSARDYATSLDLPRETGQSWASRGLWPSLIGLVAFMVFVQACSAQVQNEPILISPAQLAMLAAPALLIAFLPLYIHVAVRRPWLLVVLVLIGGGFGFLASAMSPPTPAEAWLTLSPLPWLVATAIAMILVSIWNTIHTLRRGTIDDITDPAVAVSQNRRGSMRVFMLATDWLFPIFAIIMMLVLLLFTK